ncbi:two-component regulator propeller domain-containing protein [Paraprevotella clara]|uniref:Transcriptional regulator, AraC family n=1 Tax=Paraprevotella clara YIT 11840 TaxID=762968 RepID=G5SPR9_9BACT|nr:two-component regulator propeller domain-containing protein [Paraprevotella clara]EHH00773.1 transcriptional regulator, AraC family [Paraprevotella clara YIT 11840]
MHKPLLIQYFLHILLACSLQIHFPLLHAQEISVRPIPMLDKLPVKAIHRIFQDSEGYIWYGTFDGLCRYDGYDIKVYRSDLSNPNLLASNYITYIAEDHEKKIWFGTTNGLYTLDKSTQQIKTIPLEGSRDPNVFSINVTRDGTIWASVPGILFRFRTDGSLVGKYKTEYNQAPQCAYIVYETPNGDLLISLTYSGMFKFDQQGHTLTPYFPDSDYRCIERIIWDETHQCYWLGTWERGIVRFDPKSKDPKKRYVPQPMPSAVGGQTTGNVFHMVQDDVFHYLWVTTDKDLFVFQITENGDLKQIDTSSFLPSTNKMLYEIYKDKDGNLWVSAFDMESFIIDIRRHTVRKYPLKALQEQIKAQPVINTLCVDDKGGFWFSQERYGLCFYDPITERLTHYSTWTTGKRHLIAYPYKLIPSQTPGKIWSIGSKNHIFAFKRQDMDIQIDETIQIPQTQVNTILEEDDKRLWIGTSDGLWIYDRLKKQPKNISGNRGNVTGITQTNDGKIWFSTTDKGIGCLARNKIYFYTLHKNINHIDATTYGELWLGTTTGEILSFDTQTKKITNHSATCNMSGDIINGLVVDSYNHVWIVSNQSLKEYNPRNGAYRNYKTDNPNLMLNRFLSVCRHKNDPKEIFLGGVSGIISIPSSQKIESIPIQTSAHITEIRVNAQGQWKNIPAGSFPHYTLQLSPEEQDVEIHFSTLDFHHLEQIRYAYRMKGEDRDWIYLDNGKNSAYYNNMEKGTHTFQVKATDENGQWSNHITELTIRKAPAFYETWWAYTLYALAIGGILLPIVILLTARTHPGYKLKSYQTGADGYLSKPFAPCLLKVRLQNLFNRRKAIQNELKRNTPVALISPMEFTSADEQLVRKAVKITESHLSDPDFDVLALASELGMSRSTLSRKMKALLGQTPLEFIKDIKMQHACNMLKNATMTIAEVVEALGYNDHKHFTSLFKDTFGMTPSEFQKKECAPSQKQN